MGDALHGWLGAKDDRMSGQFSQEITLEGNGRSLKEIVSSANGNLRQTLMDGHLVGGDLDMLDMQAMHLLVSMVSPSNRTVVECMLTDFDMVDGIATARKLFLQTPKMRIAGTGTMDFKDETVDLILKPVRRRLKIFSRESTIQLSGPRAKFKVEAEIDGVEASSAVTAGLVAAPVLAPVTVLELLDALLGGEGEDACKNAGVPGGKAAP